MAPPMRLAQDARRAQILACARTLFSERHYAAVSVDAVAEAAGVTRPLVHHYFGSKRDLYVAVVREMFRSGLAPVPDQGRATHPKSASRRPSARGSTWSGTTARRGWPPRAEGLGRDAEVEDILDRVREAAVDSIIEVLRLGPEDAAPELRAVLRAYGGLAEAATREWLEHERLQSREQDPSCSPHRCCSSCATCCRA